jgi:hypothetical protein
MINFDKDLNAYIAEVNEEESREILINSPLGLTTAHKCIVLVYPYHSNESSQILYFNLSLTEKEKLFDLLDSELHERTYWELDEMVCRLENELVELEEELAFLREFYEEQESVRRIGRW